MANLILPRRFTQQPQYPVEKDVNNPLSSGLTSIYLPTKRDKPITLSGNAVIAPSPSGMAYSTGAAGIVNIQDSASWTFPDTQRLTFAFVGRINAVDSPYGGLFVKRKAANNAVGPMIGRDNTNDKFRVYNGNTYAATNITISSLLGRDIVFVVTMSAASAVTGTKIYVNGVLSDSFNIVAWINTDSTGDLIIGGEQTASTNYGSNVDFSLITVWNGKVLSEYDVAEFSRNPWQIFRRSPQVLYFDTAGGGATTLTPSLFSDGDTFHAATVSVGAVTLTPALYSDGDTFHAATVSQGGAPQTLTPDLYADGDTFHTPTVGRGAVTLTPSLFSDGDTFHAATVSAGAVTLTPALFSDGDTFHAPTVTPGAVTLTPALVSDGDTFYTHAVVLEGGPQTLSPDLVVDGDTFHAATVTPGAVTLTPSIYTDADTFHAAEVSAGYNLQPEAYADPDTFYTATVSGGAVTLAPELLVDADTFYSATVSNAGLQTLEPGLLTDADTFYVPTVTGGARTLGAARSAGRQLQAGARSNIQTNRR